ncbi:hypothetical protein JCM19000A_21190 [Silvimonas sp. JCM 19000]
MQRLLAVVVCATLAAPVWADPVVLGGGTIQFVGRIVEDACTATAPADGSARPQLSGCKPEVASRTQISVQPLTRPVANPVVKQISSTPTADHKAAIVTIEYL